MFKVFPVHFTTLWALTYVLDVRIIADIILFAQACNTVGCIAYCSLWAICRANTLLCSFLDKSLLLAAVFLAHNGQQSILYGLQQILSSAAVCLLMEEQDSWRITQSIYESWFPRLWHQRRAGRTSAENIWCNIREIWRHSHSVLCSLMWFDISFICWKEPYIRL